MKVYRVDINFLSSTRDVLLSYTLFGGIAWAYRLLYGESELLKFIKDYSKNPSFLITSIFPKDGENLYLPKPYLKSDRTKTLSDYKKIKKISFIPINTFIKVLEGQIEVEQDFANENLESSVSFPKKTLEPKTKIDRITSSTEGDGELFFQESFYYSEGYFYVAFFNEDQKDKIFSSIKLLQDIGLGGDRSVGGGRAIFSKPIEDNTLKKYIDNKTNRFITLSPILIDPKIDYEDSYYDYFTFRGIIDNNYDFKNINIWKDKLIYLKEGSNFKIKEKKPFYGEVKEIKISNNVNVYQYGLAFPLYIQQGG
jgi:CRISPR-associated protein Csm4